VARREYFESDHTRNNGAEWTSDGDKIVGHTSCEFYVQKFYRYAVKTLLHNVHPCAFKLLGVILKRGDHWSPCGKITSHRFHR